MEKTQQKQLISTVIVVGFVIVLAIMLKGSTRPVAVQKPVSSSPAFNQCIDSGKYRSAVELSTKSGSLAGVNSTPKGFILKGGKVVDTIDGAIPASEVKAKIDNALASNNAGTTNINLEPVSSADFILGNPTAGVTFIEYADFQCPFCGKFFRETQMTVIDGYVKAEKINFVHRDFAFLGEESNWAGEAARCAGDQGKFWEYHNYLYNHQNGENGGAFSESNLKSFANALGLE